MLFFADVDHHTSADHTGFPSRLVNGLLSAITDVFIQPETALISFASINLSELTGLRSVK